MEGQVTNRFLKNLKISRSFPGKLTGIFSLLKARHGKAADPNPAGSGRSWYTNCVATPFLFLSNACRQGMGLASVPLTTVSCASHHESLKAGDSTETARCSGRSVANVVFADGISWKTNIHISSRSSQGLGCTRLELMGTPLQEICGSQRCMYVKTYIIYT